MEKESFGKESQDKTQEAGGWVRAIFLKSFAGLGFITTIMLNTIKGLVIFASRCGVFGTCELG